MASTLPSGVYVAYSMVTASKSVVLPSFDSQFGHIAHRQVISLPTISTPLIVLHTLAAGNLPSGTYAAFAMTTALKSVVLGATAGQYGRIYQVVLRIDQAAAPTFSCLGSIVATFNILPPPGFICLGNINLNIPVMGGVSFVNGSFTQTGNIQALFIPVITASFQCIGEISALFTTFQGQTESCISGPDTPNLSESNPKNAVF